MGERPSSPHSQFRFQVDIGAGETGAALAGFQEVTGLVTGIDVTEYRNGNEMENATQKSPGTIKFQEITLKRGLIRDLDFQRWLNDVRNDPAGLSRTVTLRLQSEDRTSVVRQWVLTNARPVKYTVHELAAETGDVAIEELVLAYDHIETAY